MLGESSLTMSALAKRLSFERAGLTMQVAYLARSGLVHREDNEQDRRKRKISLSAAGERLANGILADRREVSCQCPSYPESALNYADSSRNESEWTSDLSTLS